MNRKLLVVLLSLAMLITCIPMTAYADTEAEDVVIAEDQVIPDESSDEAEESDAQPEILDEASVSSEVEDIAQAYGEAEDVPDGWVEKDGCRYYYADGVMYYDGSYEIDGKWYMFDESGVMQTGWINQTFYTFEGDPYTCRYYADPNGVLQIGWQTIDGKRYYFDPDNQIMYYGGVQIINGKKYFLGDDGAAASGWAREDKTFYSTDFGPKAIETTWYYANSDGSLLYGWKKIGTKWYYFDPETGEMAVGFWGVGNDDYYFNASGVMQTGWIKTKDYGVTEWYYANSKGVLQWEWQKISGKWYYFSDCMEIGYEEIDGKYYFFNKSGAWVSSPSGWQQDDQGAWYYFRNGSAVTGWQKISSKWYYFDPYYKFMYTAYGYIDGKDYFFNKSGAMVSNPKGWISDADGDWYYFRNGVALTGWQKISNKWYYFYDDYPMMATGYEEIDGKYYYFNTSGVYISKPEGWKKSNDIWYYFKNGKPVTGWLELSGKWYLFDEDGWMITKWWSVKDKWYYFNESGVMQTGKVTTGGYTYNLGSNGAWDGK